MIIKKVYLEHMHLFLQKGHFQHVLVRRTLIAFLEYLYIVERHIVQNLKEHEMELHLTPFIGLRLTLQ